MRAPTPWQRLRDVVVTEGPFIGAAGLYVLACWMLIATVVVVGSTDNAANPARTTYWTLLLLTAGLYLSVRAVIRVFQPHYRSRLLLTIITSYAAVILIFAGTYYVFCALSDESQAHAIRSTYDNWIKQSEEDRADKQPASIDRRAFKSPESPWSVGGIDLNTWDKQDYSRAFWEASGSRKSELALGYDGDKRLVTLLDCLHFSVVTMTTTGYGDITPTRLYSKLTADLQILFGLAILVVALGMLFGNWWRVDRVEEIRERIQLGEFDFRSDFWHRRSPALQTDAEIRAERAAGPAPPVCPWCASPNTVHFARLFKGPAPPTRYDPRRDVLTLVVLLAVATYLVYAVLPGIPSAPMDPRGWVVSFVLITALAFVMCLLLALACNRFYRRLEAKWNAEFRQASTTYLQSWACEACRRLFIVPGSSP